MLDGIAMIKLFKKHANNIINYYYGQKIDLQNDEVIKDILHKKSSNIKSYKESLKGSGTIAQYPCEIFFEVSNFCNMKCAMCLQFSDLNKYESEHKEDAGILPMEIMEKCFGGFEHALMVHPVGFGEPLLHPEFIEFIESAKKHHVFIEFFTNGLKLNQNMSKRLIECECDTVFISFNGATKDTYNKIMLKGSFDSVVQNLADLKRLKEDYGSNKPVVGFNTIAMHPSFEELPELVRLAAKAGVGLITMKTMNIYPHNPDIHSWRRVYVPERDDPIIEEANRIAKKEGIHLDVSEFLSTKVESEKDECKLQNPQEILDQEQDIIKPMCFQPFKTFYVKASGDVKACCFAHAPLLGNLHKQSMKEIWHGELYQKFRNGVLQGHYPSDCNHCLKYNMRPKYDDTDDIFRKISTNALNKSENQYPAPQII